jgi:hypothetical protein
MICVVLPVPLFRQELVRDNPNHPETSSKWRDWEKTHLRLNLGSRYDLLWGRLEAPWNLSQSRGEVWTWDLKILWSGRWITRNTEGSGHNSQGNIPKYVWRKLGNTILWIFGLLAEIWTRYLWMERT